MTKNLSLRVFIIIYFLNFGFVGANNDDVTKIDSTALLPDDEVVAMLDSLWNSRHFQFLRDDSLYVSADDSLYFDIAPSMVSDSVYELRFAELAANSPFDFKFNKTVKPYINLYTQKRKKLTSRLLGVSEYYFPLFEELLDRYQIPLELKYLPIIESALNPRARSRVGAVGLWQFMYRTGKSYGLEINSYIDERSDPYLATEAACKFLRDLYRMYHDWDLVLAAYNAGPGNVNKAIRRSRYLPGEVSYWKIRPFLPRETRGYVPAFHAMNYLMCHAGDHQIYPQKPPRRFFEMDTVHFAEALTLEHVAQVLCMPLEELEYLNPMYKRNILPLRKKGEKNVLILPREMAGLFVSNEQAIYQYRDSKPEKLPSHEEILATTKIIHVVRNGEVLGAIARKYRVSYRDIQIWNNLRSANSIKVGQKLAIYKSPGAYQAEIAKKKSSVKSGDAKISSSDGRFVYYTVQRGDTLWDIANRYQGVTVMKIKNWNNHVNERSLKAGQKLKIAVGG